MHFCELSRYKDFKSKDRHSKYDRSALHFEGDVRLYILLILLCCAPFLVFNQKHNSNLNWSYQYGENKFNSVLYELCISQKKKK